MVATCGTLPAFTAIKAGISPVPLAANPMDGLLLVQLNTSVPPVVGLVNTTGAVSTPAHKTWLAGWSTCGVGFTVMVNVNGKLIQVIPPLV